MADGDGRAVINLAEEIFGSVKPGRSNRPRGARSKLVQRRAPLYDKGRDGHYNLISALHKAVRGSDPDAALYYFCRMLDGGEDRLFIARRLVRMAVEDIGLADPQALVVTNAAKEAFDFLGSPRGSWRWREAVIYVATAPKSNANYVAYKAPCGRPRSMARWCRPRSFSMRRPSSWRTRATATATSMTTTSPRRSRARTTSPTK